MKYEKCNVPHNILLTPYLHVSVKLALPAEEINVASAHRTLNAEHTAATRVCPAGEHQQGRAADSVPLTARQNPEGDAGGGGVDRMVRVVSMSMISLCFTVHFD